MAVQKKGNLKAYIKISVYYSVDFEICLCHIFLLPANFWLKSPKVFYISTSYKRFISNRGAENMIELGGNITLVGFKDVDPGSMLILKKIVGNYTRKLSEKIDGFESLELNRKEIHKTEGSEKHEIKAKIVAKGKLYNAESTDRNLFIAVDNVLKKIENSI